ncbi:MAG TPA: DUF3592 domain-containing protein [Armatimonadota bacterium]|nr:DUF3592 domain-containing protein [Armatimonadota bacterium]
MFHRMDFSMEWRCEQCGADNGPEAAYCVECGEAEPAPGERPAGDVMSMTLSKPGAESRDTLVGTSTGIAPSLLDRGTGHALMQPLPRKVRLGIAGWTALVGGWPELCICLVTLPLVAIGVYAAGMMIGGILSALIGMAGVALFVVLAFLYGAPETSRTLRGYRLARNGWAAGGEITRKLSQKGRFGSAFQVEYSYTDARGVIRRGRQEVSREQWQEMPAHSRVTILYNPDRPQISTIYELLGVVALEKALGEGTEDEGRRTEGGGEGTEDEGRWTEEGPC